MSRLLVLCGPCRAIEAGADAAGRQVRLTAPSARLDLVDHTSSGAEICLARLGSFGDA